MEPAKFIHSTQNLIEIFGGSNLNLFFCKTPQLPMDLSYLALDFSDVHIQLYQQQGFFWLRGTLDEAMP